MPTQKETPHLMRLRKYKTKKKKQQLWILTLIHWLRNIRQLRRGEKIQIMILLSNYCVENLKTRSKPTRPNWRV